jgi:hypothetical protein
MAFREVRVYEVREVLRAHCLATAVAVCIHTRVTVLVM